MAGVSDAVMRGHGDAEKSKNHTVNERSLHPGMARNDKNNLNIKLQTIILDSGFSFQSPRNDGVFSPASPCPPRRRVCCSPTLPLPS